MTNSMGEKEIRLRIPAKGEYALVARMALSGLGSIAGLEMDLIGDLRTVTNECCDCLTHQPLAPARIELCAWVLDERLYCRFTAEERTTRTNEKPLDMDITRGVLETLMPDVQIDADGNGVYSILCSMPI